MATHVSSTDKYVRLLVMTKQSKLNIYLNLPAKLMVCHTPYKSTMERWGGGRGCDDVPNGRGESYIAIYKMSCNFMLEI